MHQQNQQQHKLLKRKRKNNDAIVKKATTEEVFGTQLHSYNIVDAITDENVLPFRYHYCRTIKDIENYNKKSLNNKAIDNNNIHSEWKNFIETRKLEELDKLIKENKLNKEETYKYMAKIFENKKVKESGTDIDRILPKVGFSATSNRYALKRNVYEKIKRFFDRFFTISSNRF